MSSPLFGQDLDTLREVRVDLGGGRTELVYLDPEQGPVKYKLDGGVEFQKCGAHNDMQFLVGRDRCHAGGATKGWRQYSATEKEITLIQVAKMNATTRARWEADKEKARMTAQPAAGSR
mmetsp:Transcript_112669/g.313379  ORF Transcript_112669/g.313379 Transcript_112669/m.313379 type:complete len:119 (-) Transcript_112669:71-427(-)